MAVVSPGQGVIQGDDVDVKVDGGTRGLHILQSKAASAFAPAAAAAAAASTARKMAEAAAALATAMHSFDGITAVSDSDRDWI